MRSISNHSQQGMLHGEVLDLSLANHFHARKGKRCRYGIEEKIVEGLRNIYGSHAFYDIRVKNSLCQSFATRPLDGSDIGFHQQKIECGGNRGSDQFRGSYRHGGIAG